MTSAMRRMRPPHVGQPRTSIEKHLLRSSAQRNGPTSMYALHRVELRGSARVRAVIDALRDVRMSADAGVDAGPRRDGPGSAAPDVALTRSPTGSALGRRALGASRRDERTRR